MKPSLMFSFIYNKLDAMTVRSYAVLRGPFWRVWAQFGHILKSAANLLGISFCDNSDSHAEEREPGAS